MTVAPTLNGQIIGQAQYATRAVLERVLARTGSTFNQLLTLNYIAANGGSVDALVVQLTGALKVDQAVIRATLAELTDAHLVDAAPGGEVQLTRAGSTLQQQLQAAGADIAARLYRDLPAADLQAAARVLIELTARANAELAN